MATVHPLRSARQGKGLWITFFVLFAVVAVHVFIDRLYGYRLHAALGYGDVYLKNMWFELITRYVGALLYAAMAAWMVRAYAAYMPLAAYRAVRLLFVALGWLIGYALWTLNPSSWYLFFHHAAFHRADPLLHLDDSFYVYDLPLIAGFAGRVVFTLFIWLVHRLIRVASVVARQHMVAGGSLTATDVHRELRGLVNLLAVLFVCFAALVVLGRYQAVLGSSADSFLFGPGFVTAKLGLPFFSWLHVLGFLVVAGALFWTAQRTPQWFPIKDGFVSLSRRSFTRILQSGAFLVATLIVSPVVDGLVNTLYVHPNQNQVELPYIQHTIDETRWALGVGNVRTQSFTPSNNVTQADIKRDANALANVRINDQNQTTAIYNQLQSFKSYFQFDATSVDRYNTSEVYTSARQLNVDNLPVQTWINRTLVYTHGYGVAISPVNQFDQDGLPTLWAKDTPQTTQPPIPPVKVPQIYFGTMNNDVVAPSKQAEFDYPLGSADSTSHYAGGYGLPIFGNRLLLTIEQGTLRFFTSDQLTAQSQLLFDRNIYTRVQDIAPFLTYDHDAFPFVDASGRILWMLDAYTETPNIPYAQTYMGTAYIRNAVKVVIDAYTGKVTFYVVDPTDPLLQSLEQAYPSVFTHQIPADISTHFRYPLDLFQAQAQALTRYHMTDASAFYNQEDLWSIANQIYQQNDVAPRPPVYQMIRMPDQTTPHFVLSALFTPATKDNLNGWLIADNEPGRYGRLTLYQFPQSSLIFGPMQAENQIDADPNISAQLTLWNQQGSQVVRGDVLLVPIGGNLLYIEPVYLVANRQNSLPQLERVIVDYNKQVYMDTSLGAAVQDLITGQAGAGSPTPNVPTGGGGAGATGGAGAAGQGAAGGAGAAGQGALIQQANQLFQQYETDTAHGNLQAAGRDLQQLGSVLAKLKGLGPGSQGK